MVIEIGTRSSPLALWQAKAVGEKLSEAGHNPTYVKIESSGDIDLSQPIYAMGITGVFTKELDIAVLNRSVSVAVHSLKDIPTRLAKGLTLAAVLERGAHSDVLIAKHEIGEADHSVWGLATSSIRRRSQWLARYPHHRMMPIRGNVQTRLRKFAEGKDIQGVIFAKAGLERMNLLPENSVELDWMIPAPAQGIVAVVCRTEDREMKNICRSINHLPSFQAAAVERSFMRYLLGGCSVPVSAHAVISREGISFRGAIHATDGSKCNTIEQQFDLKNWESAGNIAAAELLKQPGAEALLNEIRKNTSE
nr:hydroxymethylbilane synthase [Saprospiraceae bacterium]